MKYELGPILENVEIGKIDPPVFQHRTNLVIDDLAESIREKGLLYPLIVRVNGDRFQLVAGQRRFLACKKIGLRRIQCQVLELNDREAFEIGLIENIQRSSMDPLDEARAFQRYVDELGYGGMTELSGKIGKSLTYVSRRIAMLQLPQEVQDRFLRRRNRSSIAVEFLSMSDPQEMVQIARKVDRLDMSVQKTRNLLRKQRSSDPGFRTEQERIRLSIRAIDRSITALKLALARLDDAIESVQKDWFVRELLFQYHVSVHDQIDSLIHLKKKFYQRAQNGRRELPISELR